MVDLPGEHFGASQRWVALIRFAPDTPIRSISRWYFEGSAGAQMRIRSQLSDRHAPPCPRVKQHPTEKRWTSRIEIARALRHAAPRDLCQWRLSDRADHGLTPIEQSRLGSRRRRGLRPGRAVHRVAAFARNEGQAVALERTVHHRRAPRKGRGRGADGRNFKADEKGRKRDDRAAAADEVSRKTPHG